ncbi:MAG: hypothetical protein QM572_06850 [Nocardioides sp.]|uniref:hypothetical protein n=1 Tax=Nocardioides sp. TaxID=35761 RepID=UPI0039E5EBF6
MQGMVPFVGLIGVDFEELTGLSKFTIELITFPIFSAFAGVITNWTGVWMLFAPLHFAGFRCPGAKTVYAFLPRKLQVLPIWAPNPNGEGMLLGFQGFIPARAERMASICVDKGLSRLGSVRDFMQELDPVQIAETFALHAIPELRNMTDEVMRREHPELWAQLPQQFKEVVYQRVEQRAPEIANHAMMAIEEHVDDLIDIKLLAVAKMREHPEILKNIIYDLGSKELKMMVWIGLWMGFPFGLLLALVVHFSHHIPVLSLLPSWLIILSGASLIGIVVNIIAIKMVFEPADPAPRWRYLWGQAAFAKRQHEAAASFGHSLAYEIITMPNIINDLLYGPRSDKTRVIVEKIMMPEVDAIVGPARAVVRAAVGGTEFKAIRAGTAGAALDFAPRILEDVDFTQRQAEKIDEFCTTKLRELPPEEFMEMLYSAVEQDAWLLYAHGGLLGVLVGVLHLIIFGA